MSTQDIINDFCRNYLPTLRLLSQRTCKELGLPDLDSNAWMTTCDNLYVNDGKIKTAYCKICQITFIKNTGSEIYDLIMDHGIEHLKKSNLLPFI